MHLENVAELMKWVDEGKLAPHVGATYPFAEAGRAITDMKERRAKGKLVVLV